MANREACELYIEQEIKDALAEGKKPWTIGKEISKWVEKLFETTINPQTIKSRAIRMQEKLCSNEQKNSKVIEKTEKIERDTNTTILDTRKPQGGGAREGAGRPPKKEECNIDNLMVVSCAMQYSEMAITQLEKIQPNDPERNNAFNNVIAWCEKQLNN